MTETVSFLVTDDCHRLGLRAGAVLFRGVRVAPSSPALRAEIAAEVERIRAKYAGPAEMRAVPEVAAFGEVLRKVGVNPRKEQPSVERLLNFALKRGDLPAINNLVDAYNLISVRSLCSLGAHDLDRIRCPVSLRLLTGAESFIPLGHDAPVPVTAGEYGYVDADNRVLCRLDLLQAEFSKVMTEAVNVLLIVEGTTAHTPEMLRRAFAEVVDAVTHHCGGTAEVVACPAAD
ncbi:MAG TPA: phenylalanine--tRNA ligase beta subunit-related protein [Gemmataceae bacterium]|nr:phenylalanine--tRNA ligase beta subunit-related protein [Gemmataceae bacterium]